MPHPTPRLRSRTILRVIANPFFAYDHQGRLCAAVRYDPEHGRPGEIHHIDALLTTTVVEHRTEQKQIGAVTYRVPLRAEDGTPGVLRPGMAKPERAIQVGGDDVRDHTVEHLLEGASLPHTDYHVFRIRDGALLPIDKATHRLAFGPKVPFQEPSAALLAAKATLIAQWKAEYPDEEVPDWPDRVYPPAAAPAGEPTTSAARPSPDKGAAAPSVRSLPPALSPAAPAAASAEKGS